ncbi:hypothetical protein PMAYCL1PPCAC_07755, partial [Pristionchus mayeri]
VSNIRAPGTSLSSELSTVLVIISEAFQIEFIRSHVLDRAVEVFYRPTCPGQKIFPTSSKSLSEARLI